MIILGIETSCDDTGIAIFQKNNGILANKVFSQNFHAKYGGVVPELASRDHLSKIRLGLSEVLEKSKITLKDISAVAYTRGPGLLGSLLIGCSFGKALAYSLKIPSIGIHHLEGHILSPLIHEENLKPPFVALLISGGHTQFIYVKDFFDYHLLGETLDDALGEAFDKTAKLLGLGYPGGPLLERLAANGDSSKYPFPKPLINNGNHDFSFSGLKTAVAKEIGIGILTNKKKADVAASFQKTITEILCSKIEFCLNEKNCKKIVIAGGVSANMNIRKSFSLLSKKKNIDFFFPKNELCTDNGAMIAYAGLLRLNKQKIDTKKFEMSVLPRWSILEL